MFGFMNKLKGAYADLANSSVKAENKDLMEAMIAGAVLVAFADGELSSEEANVCRDIVGSSEQLKVFGQEPMQLFDKYCDKFEASKRMAKMDLLKEIGDVASNADEAARVLIMCIEVADADGNIDAEETEMLTTIAGKLNLRLTDFM